MTTFEQAEALASVMYRVHTGKPWFRGVHFERNTHTDFVVVIQVTHQFEGGLEIPRALGDVAIRLEYVSPSPYPPFLGRPTIFDVKTPFEQVNDLYNFIKNLSKDLQEGIKRLLDMDMTDPIVFDSIRRDDEPTTKEDEVMIEEATEDIRQGRVSTTTELLNDLIPTDEPKAR